MSIFLSRVYNNVRKIICEHIMFTISQDYNSPKIRMTKVIVDLCFPLRVDLQNYRSIGVGHTSSLNLLFGGLILFLVKKNLRSVHRKKSCEV